MINSEKLLELGRQLSADFLEKNADMTEGLKKLAEKYNLNEDQLARIAETANTETYLALIKEAEDKYIYFPLADIKQIKSVKKEAEYYPDYNEEYPDLEPEGDISLLKSASLEEYVNTDNIKSIKETERKFEKMRFDLEVLEERLIEKKAEIEHNLDKLKSLTKQLILSEEYDYADLKNIIKTASKNYGDGIIQVLNELQYSIPGYDFEKIAEENKFINTDSKYYKLVSEIDNQLNEIVKLAEFAEYKYFDTIEKIESDDCVKTAGLGKIFLGLVKRPLLATTIVGVPTAFILGKRAGESGHLVGTKDALLNKYTTYLAMKNKPTFLR